VNGIYLIGVGVDGCLAYASDFIVAVGFWFSFRIICLPGAEARDLSPDSYFECYLVLSQGVRIGHSTTYGCRKLWHANVRYRVSLV
jgi:hypothetical protein